MKNFRTALMTLMGVSLFAVAPLFAQNALFVDATGEVGIGTSTPTFPLHVITPAAPSNTVVQLENTGPARFRFKNNSNGETWNVGHRAPSGTGLVFSDVGDGDSELVLDIAGNLTITGTLTAGPGGTTFPDYVFSPEYELMPVNELATFVRENKHLPNVPSADEVKAAKQINMSEFQYKLLEKIEELTLYTIQQQQNIEELRAQIKELQQQTPKTN